jgi:endonuclease V-like protein UPF0215 family
MSYENRRELTDLGALAGTDRDHAIALIEATLHKSRMPEPLRLAHLTASALGAASE